MGILSRIFYMTLLKPKKRKKVEKVKKEKKKKINGRVTATALEGKNLNQNREEGG